MTPPPAAAVKGGARPQVSPRKSDVEGIERVYVWDLLVRMSHWIIMICVFIMIIIFNVIIMLFLFRLFLMIFMIMTIFCKYTS